MKRTTIRLNREAAADLLECLQDTADKSAFTRELKARLESGMTAAEIICENTAAEKIGVALCCIMKREAIHFENAGDGK